MSKFGFTQPELDAGWARWTRLTTLGSPSTREILDYREKPHGPEWLLQNDATRNLPVVDRRQP